MTIRSLSLSHPWVRFPSFYNAYFLRNEVAATSVMAGGTPASFGDIFIDDYYGRIFDLNSRAISAKYGKSTKMRHYVAVKSLETVDELRVPYRRIPVFSADNLALIDQAVAEMRAVNTGYEILLRGQTKLYLVDRTFEENMHLYGEETVREPSFLPSHLRNNFDPLFLKCMWQSQAAILLNDIGFEVGKLLTEAQYAALLNDTQRFRNSPLFILFALGIAQHYGMPSVGLDLTDQLDVACWFATHTIRSDETGLARNSLIEFEAEQTPTIFVFRCPPDAVFNYQAMKLPSIPEGRPDRQAAWFGHVGWGAASNQLASYLMCAFRLEPEVANNLNVKLDRDLFPDTANDPILNHFLTMRGMQKYEGEARRALRGIYYISD